AFGGTSISYAGYEALFGRRAEAPVRLEATPIYMYWRAAPERIAAYNASMKLILILRNPAERAVSQWEMEFSREAETENFDIALEREREFLSEHPGKHHR